MPPKKKREEPKADIGGGVVNFYDKLPKEFLDKVDNPNFHLHKIKLPCRMCVVAPSGSGKTNFIMNFIALMSEGRGTFQSICIITRNKDEPLYRFLEAKSEGQIIIKEGVHNTPPLDKMDKEFNHLVIWDDLVLSKDLSTVENYYIRARKLNCSCIFLSQSYFRIPKMIRNNCSYLVLLKLSGNREVNMILSEQGLGVSKDELLQLYEYATKQKLSPLVIDCEAPPEDRYRRGFTEILSIRRDADEKA